MHLRRGLFTAVAAAMLAITLTACGGIGLSASSRTRAAKTGSSEDPAHQTFNGSFTTLSGVTTTISAYRGSPTLVWFIAAGCASCAASIPAVAQQLPSFSQARTHILVLGLYGFFDKGTRGLSELASFGRAAAGSAFSSQAWTWGLASAALTASYDPEGVPDDYFLLNPAGQVFYHNSVPVSTMGSLLAHLQSLTGARVSPVPTTASGVTLP